jgi:RNA polymerase sigma factor (sigma-70 family)
MPEIHELYDKHGSEILGYLARRCSDGSADDLLQETFLQAARQSGRIAQVAMPRAWLFGIARNLLARHLRKKSESERLNSALSENSEAASADLRLPAMRDAIRQLPEELRETLELRLEQELSYEEIASALDIPVGTVRSRLHNAVRRLRATLTQTEEKS